MITNRIKIEFVGHVGYLDVHLLMAKGLKRLFATSTETGDVKCPETLIERKDLNGTDYNICTDLFQHIWLSTGTEEEFPLRDVKWKHLGKTVDEITMKAFVNRYGLGDVFNFHDEELTKEPDFLKRATMNALFITKFNLEETGFLADTEDENKDE